MSSLTVTFKPPAKLLSLNDRLHWRPKAQLTAMWVVAARWAATDALRDNPEWVPCPVTITVTLPVRDNRRRDPHNLFATVKPCIDGIVIAGVVPDDDSRWVTTTEPVLHVRGRDVVIHITPRGDR
jgi:hypothetical protein